MFSSDQVAAAASAARADPKLTRQPSALAAAAGAPDRRGTRRPTQLPAAPGVRLKAAKEKVGAMMSAAGAIAAAQRAVQRVAQRAAQRAAQAAIDLLISLPSLSSFFALQPSRLLEVAMQRYVRVPLPFRLRYVFSFFLPSPFSHLQRVFSLDHEYIQRTPYTLLHLLYPMLYPTLQSYL